jgi:hypothetical protein
MIRIPDTKPTRRSVPKRTGSIAFATLLALTLGAVFTAPASADERDHYRREDHRHWGGGYYGPPAIYGSPYYGGPGYYPPPVIYGPGVGVTLPGVNLNFR